METRTIFFTGKPGCGKGTQAKFLAEKTGWQVVSAGEELRAIAAEDTLLGRRVKSEVDAGVLVPYWFVTFLYLKTLSTLKDGESLILDGFNRKVPEAETIIESMQWLERPFTILNIQISDEEMRRRLALRRDIEGRADDAVESVLEERLREYREHTEPAIEIFRNAGMMLEINGEQAPEKVAEDIRRALDIK